jgi:hypothetical protein
MGGWEYSFPFYFSKPNLKNYLENRLSKLRNIFIFELLTSRSLILDRCVGMFSLNFFILYLQNYHICTLGVREFRRSCTLCS